MWYRIFQLNFFVVSQNVQEERTNLESEFSFGESLTTYIADSRKLLHLSRILLCGGLPGELVRCI